MSGAYTRPSGVAGELCSRVRITAIAEALGAKVQGKRCQAFWRKGGGFNVSLNDQKNCWHDFVCGEGGGVLDLIRTALGCDRRAALQWLADFTGQPLDIHTWSASERREYGRRRHAAEREAARLVAWRTELLLAARESRDLALRAYHRGLKLILTHSLEHPRAGLWADATEHYLARYQELDQQIDAITGADWDALAAIYREVLAA